MGRGIAVVSDSKSPERTEIEAGAEAVTGGVLPVSAAPDGVSNSSDWLRTIPRPPVPVLPRMLPATGCGLVDQLPSCAAVLPTGIAILAESRLPEADRAAQERSLEALAARLEAFRPAEPRLVEPPQGPPLDQSPPLPVARVAPAREPAAAVPLPLPALPRPAQPGLARAARIIRSALKWTAITFALWILLTVAFAGLFRFVNPPASMLMLVQRLSGQSIEHTWAPLDAISPSLMRAVITSEDAQFCHHWGFDFGEIRASLKSRGGYGRGASTITQQVAKNMFLWPGKSYLRKALEVPVTLIIEGLWPKRRIFEVYVNIAEWGPGVFGAEAASQYYFSHPAATLSEREAALLAVALPNPIARDASDPDPAVVRRATRLQARMRLPGTRGCVLNLK